MEYITYRMPRGEYIKIYRFCKADARYKEIVGKTYTDNISGPFKVIEVIGTRVDKIKSNGDPYALVEFINTGTRLLFSIDRILYNNGGIRDPYAKVIFGVACKGIIYYGDYDKRYIHRAQYTWNGMLQRCYDKNSKTYRNYGAKHITVCERWLCFEYFLQDLPKIENHDLWANDNHYPTLYQLDKDIKQLGVPDERKVYSLETCMFVLAGDNSRERSERKESKGSKYRYVTKTKYGAYSVLVNYNGKTYRPGVLDNEDAAATLVNRLIKAHNLPLPLNNIDNEMSLHEALLHRQHTNMTIPLCNIVDNSLPYEPHHDVSGVIDESIAARYSGINISSSKSYSVTFNTTTVKGCLGSFDDIYAALTVRNAYCKYIYHLPIPPNNFVMRPMSISEALAHRSTFISKYRRIPLCHIVDKSQPRHELCKIVDKENNPRP